MVKLFGTNRIMPGIGGIFYSNHSGLGQMAKGFREHLKLDSQLVICHGIKGTFPISIQHTFGDIHLTDDQIIKYLDTCSPNIVIVIETPFNFNLFKICYDRGIKIVVIPMVDSIAFSKFVPHLKYITKFWMPILWGYNFYKEKTDKAIYLPFPIDTEYFSCPGLSKELVAPADFLHNQGFGGAGYRKATDSVFTAFQQLFYIYSKATMVVRSQPCDAEHSQLRTIKNVLLHIDDLKESVDTYKDGRIYICPSRREGLGLPILEAMSCGLSVITANAPPMYEWFPEDYPFLVKVRGNQPLSYGDIPMYEPDVYDLMQKMKFAYENGELVRQWGIKNRNIVEDNYSWRVLKEKYIKELEKLCS